MIDEPIPAYDKFDLTDSNSEKMWLFLTKNGFDNSPDMQFKIPEKFFFAIWGLMSRIEIKLYLTSISDFKLPLRQPHVENMSYLSKVIVNDDKIEQMNFVLEEGDYQEVILR